MASWSAASAEAVEPALLDAYVGVRLDARRRLGDHPLVTRAAALEASIDGVRPLYGAEPPGVWGQSLDLTGLWDPDALIEREAAERILPKLRALPVDDIVGFVPSHSFIERARAAKPVCKACKQPFTTGEPQLLIRTEDDLLADAKPYHPSCAAKGKTKKALEAAAARWRHPLGPES